MVSWMRIACALLGLVVLALFPSGLARAQGGDLRLEEGSETRFTLSLPA